MYYSKSSVIKKKINKSNSILITCHTNPDADSLGSALSLYYVTKKWGKDSLVVSPTEIASNLNFLKDSSQIKQIDYTSFDFSNFDLLVALDSSSYDMVTGNKDKQLPNIPTIVIDHHHTNTKYGEVNLVSKSSSTAEILYGVYKDWGIDIDKETATAILTGIIGDTGLFKFDYGIKPDPKKDGPMAISQKLLDIGADKVLIIKQLFQTIDIGTMKFWGEVLQRLKIDKKHKFAYAAVPYDIYKKHGSPQSSGSSAATNFMSSVKDTDFGIMIVEETKGVIKVGLRGRTEFDTSKIAVELGGGGHAPASGAMIKGVEFKKVVSEVLKVARKHSK